MASHSGRGVLGQGLAILAVLASLGGALAADVPLPSFTNTPLRIPETMQRVTSLEFSPDGKYILSGHGWYERSGSFQIWEVATGKRVALHVLPIGVSSVGWLPEGDKFAI